MFFLVVLNGFTVVSRDCKCEDEFLFLKDFIQTNYAGFQDKVNTETLEAYQEFTNEIIHNIREHDDLGSCIFWIGEWLAWFKDRHIQFRGHFNLNELGEDERKTLINKREGIVLDDQLLASLEKSTGIEGIYWIQDSTYQIALVKREGGFRNYAGIIVHSSNPNWFPGQVKLELRYTTTGLLNGVLYYSNHQPHHVSYTIHPNQLGEAWFRHGSTPRPTLGFKPVDSRVLSDSTLYLRIGTFEEWNLANVDSLVQYHHDQLSTMPNLIIDVRNNGGGSDFTFMPLVPWIVSGPVELSGSDILATPANIASWKPLLDNPYIPDESKSFIDSLIREMEMNQGNFVSLMDDKTTEPDSLTIYPRKIAILINKNCASSCENFALYAKESEKVILMGENTAGILDYANMREQKFSCLPYTLYYATTRSRRVDLGKGIDNVGIPPRVQLSGEQDWINEALELLEK